LISSNFCNNKKHSLIRGIKSIRQIPAFFHRFFLNSTNGG
jgi:hypothetical protein